ncbi:histidine phosphatase family protein [Paenibacillus protaetiae]|uniref:Histidine phosphatase family protein n=1 Tax=Paenibacillus protaetiae TaxID=2509456 RepID=A0A4P6EVC8_9BACL|nr:histidine phosphatase family protein [Paenibacillus protaetiae]QAY66982.1 histidine phosphatase family protein [Paenibacillus protaetiae]
MKHIYIVRHCKAEGQEADAPLTPAGMEQAELLARFLSNKKIDAIISSPFKRACQSVQPLSGRIGIGISVDERLQERMLSHPGRPEWRDMLRLTFDDLHLCYEGGESSYAAMERAACVVAEALNSEKQHIVVVSHGNLIALLLKHFDSRIGFETWEAMSNPDVFHLSFRENKPSVQRIWEGGLNGN